MKSQQLTLDNAKRGAVYTIKLMHPHLTATLRLMELGFRNGATVAILQRNRWQGLLKVKIKNTRFALPRSEAKAIEVEPLVTVKS